MKIQYFIKSWRAKIENEKKEIKGQINNVKLFIRHCIALRIFSDC